jgi:hypothetical protein
MWRTVLVASSTLIIGCTNHSGTGDAMQTSASRPADACPMLGQLPREEGWQLAQGGSYHAEQSGGFVFIHAAGDTPAGSQLKFFQRMTREWPPTIMLYRKLSSDPVIAVQVDYRICAKFRSDEPVAGLRVIDGSSDKPTEVKVEQVRQR